jgi:hypothetical protein
MDTAFFYLPAFFKHNLLQKKRTPRLPEGFAHIQQLAVVMPGIAIAAIHGAVAAGLKRNLRRHTALIADDIKHLTLTAIGVAAVCPASRAAARLVLEASLGIKCLFGRCEDEFGAALTAY